MMDDEIAGRIERLSPEARALFWEVVRGGEETEFRVPPDELVVDLHQRMAGLLLQDRVEFVDLFRAIKRQAHTAGASARSAGRAPYQGGYDARRSSCEA